MNENPRRNNPGGNFFSTALAGRSPAHRSDYERNPSVVNITPPSRRRGYIRDMENNHEIYTTDDLRNLAQAHNVMGDVHFFNPNSMRFFNSRVSKEIHKGRFFITSEKGPDNVRKYTVRQYEITTANRESDGREMTNLRITDASDFQQFATLSQARSYIRGL